MNFSVLILLLFFTMSAHANVCANLFQKPFITSVEALTEEQKVTLKDLAKMELAITQIENPLQRNAKLAEVHRYKESLREQGISIGVYYQIKDSLTSIDQNKARTQRLELDKQSEVLEVLKELSKFTEKSPEDALFHFARTGELESIVVYLISLGRLDPNITNGRGRTALSTAIGVKNNKTTEALLNIEKVDVLLENKKGFNAFDYATYFKNEEALRLLKEKRPNIRFKEKSQDELENIHVAMEFVEVKAGKFRSGQDPKEPDRSDEEELKHDFEFMSYQVTQRQWALVMKENRSKFVEGEESIVLDINGNKIKMQPDHPVESVSGYQIHEFVEKLNTLSQNNDPLIYKIIPSHKKGYKYRLNYETEWEYVARNRGQANEKYYFGNREKELAEHAWFKDNSNGSTQAVGQKKPLLIDGDPNKPIYDMYGNVSELTYGGSGLHAALGGNYRDIPMQVGVERGDILRSRESFHFVGFRLLRIAP